MTQDDRRAALVDASRDAATRETPRRATTMPPPPPRHQTPYTREELLRKLARSDIFLERSLLLLYGFQTTDEQSSHATREENGVGFNQVDAPFLSSVAQQVEANRDGRTRVAYPEGQRLSVRQRAIVRQRLPKYVGQLVAYANRRFNAAP